MAYVSKEERESWTESDVGLSTKIRVRGRCVSTRVVNTKGRHSIILEFETDEDEPRVVVRFFNVSKGQGKTENHIAPHNGAFAQIYRLTIGQNPKKRYCKAQQLAKHLVGFYFYIDPKFSHTSNNTYWRTQISSPVNPIVTTEWSNAGTLYDVIKSAPVKRESGNNGEKPRRKSGEDVEIEKTAKPQSYLGSGKSSITLKPITNNPDTPPSSMLIAINKDEEIVDTKINRVSPTERVFQYYQRPSETEEEYHQRVIDESWIS